MKKQSKPLRASRIVAPRGWRVGLLRCQRIVWQFAKLDEVDRRYILARLAADHAKMSSANKGSSVSGPASGTE